jgi:hypothetical protein
MGSGARQRMNYCWRSRFSRLISNVFKLELSTVFDFATSITFGAHRLLDGHASSSSSQVHLRLPFTLSPRLSFQETYFL